MLYLCLICYNICQNIFFEEVIKNLSFKFSILILDQSDKFEDFPAQLRKHNCFSKVYKKNNTKM